MPDANFINNNRQITDCQECERYECHCYGINCPNYRIVRVLEDGGICENCWHYGQNDALAICNNCIYALVNGERIVITRSYSRTNNN
jgi:hypothetical protein